MIQFLIDKIYVCYCAILYNFKMPTKFWQQTLFGFVSISFVSMYTSINVKCTHICFELVLGHWGNHNHIVVTAPIRWPQRI